MKLMKIAHASGTVEALYQAMMATAPIENFPKDITISKTDTTALFEKLFGGTLTMGLEPESTHRRYKDDRTELHFQAFKAAFTIASKRLHLAIKSKVKKDNLTSPFIVGRFVDDGTIQFSKRPVLQKNITKAVDESIRLHSTHGGAFGVFGLYYQTSGDAIKREVSKQGVSGKPTPNPGKTMHKLQQFIENNDIAAMNVPIGVTVSAGGKYLVNYSLSAPEQVDSYGLGIEKIAVWLNSMEQTKEGVQP